MRTHGHTRDKCSGENCTHLRNFFDVTHDLFELGAAEHSEFAYKRVHATSPVTTYPHPPLLIPSHLFNSCVLYRNTCASVSVLEYFPLFTEHVSLHIQPTITQVRFVDKRAGIVAP